MVAYKHLKLVHCHMYNYVKSYGILKHCGLYSHTTTKSYFILLKSGTGDMVILLSMTALQCGLYGSSATISLMYSIYLKQNKINFTLSHLNLFTIK